MAGSIFSSPKGHVMDNIELTEPTLHYLEPPLLLKNTRAGSAMCQPKAVRHFKSRMAARGAAFGDLDNDGFIDVAINCNDGPAVILQSRRQWESLAIGQPHWFGQQPRWNRRPDLRLVTEDGSERYAYVSTAGSYFSASDKRAHFGLGSSKKARLVEISWPSGVQQRLESVAADQILTVHEKPA